MVCLKRGFINTTTIQNHLCGMFDFRVFFHFPQPEHLEKGIISDLLWFNVSFEIVYLLHFSNWINDHSETWLWEQANLKSELDFWWSKDHISLQKMFDININFLKVVMALISYKGWSYRIKHHTQITWVSAYVENQILFDPDRKSHSGFSRLMWSTASLPKLQII